jgi:hypothetical protein
MYFPPQFPLVMPLTCVLTRSLEWLVYMPSECHGCGYTRRLGMGLGVGTGMGMDMWTCPKPVPVPKTHAYTWQKAAYALSGNTAQPHAHCVLSTHHLSQSHTPVCANHTQMGRIHVTRLIANQPHNYQQTHPLYPSTTSNLADASHSHDWQSNDCLAPCARVTKEEEEEGEEEGREWGEEGKEMGEEGKENRKRANPGKSPTPPSPLTTDHPQDLHSPSPCTPL